jgi:hypothetical protein
MSETPGKCIGADNARPCDRTAMPKMHLCLECMTEASGSMPPDAFVRLFAKGIRAGQCRLGCGRAAAPGQEMCADCYRDVVTGVTMPEPAPDNVRKLQIIEGGKGQPEGPWTPGRVVDELTGWLRDGNLTGIVMMARHADGSLTVRTSELPKELSLTMADLLLHVIRKSNFGV